MHLAFIEAEIDVDELAKQYQWVCNLAQQWKEGIAIHYREKPEELEGLQNFCEAVIECLFEDTTVYDRGNGNDPQYTVVIDKAIFEMSDDPYHPRGVDRFCAEFTDDVDVKEFGDEISILDIPSDVRKAIRERIDY